MSYFVFLIGVLMGVGCLSYAYAGRGLDLVVRGLLVLGVAWLVAGRQRWVWFSTLALVILVALAGYGLWVQLSPGWMIAGAVGALIAWDMTEFMRRLRFAPLRDDLRGLERRHLTRLTIVVLIGMALASIAMLVRLEFTFEWIVLLTLVAALGITQLVSWLRRGGG
jgi:hypothetical protein